MKNLTTPSYEENLCICKNSLDAFYVKNAIQRASSVYVSLEKRKNRTFIVKVKNYNYKKAITLIMNNNYLMMSVKPSILAKKEAYGVIDVPVRKMISMTNNIA